MRLGWFLFSLHPFHNAWVSYPRLFYSYSEKATKPFLASLPLRPTMSRLFTWHRGKAKRKLIYASTSSQWFSELAKQRALKLFKNIEARSPSPQKFWKWGPGMCILSKLFEWYWSVGGQKLQIYVSFSKGAPWREKTDQCWVKCLKAGNCKGSRQDCLGTETKGWRGIELQVWEAMRREEAISR